MKYITRKATASHPQLKGRDNSHTVEFSFPVYESIPEAVKDIAQDHIVRLIAKATEDKAKSAVRALIKIQLDNCLSSGLAPRVDHQMIQERMRRWRPDQTFTAGVKSGSKEEEAHLVWYKNLSPEQRAEFHRQAEASTNEILEVVTLPPPPDAPAVAPPAAPASRPGPAPIPSPGTPVKPPEAAAAPVPMAPAQPAASIPPPPKFEGETQPAGPVPPATPPPPPVAPAAEPALPQIGAIPPPAAQTPPPTPVPPPPPPTAPAGQDEEF